MRCSIDQLTWPLPEETPSRARHRPVVRRRAAISYVLGERAAFAPLSEAPERAFQDRQPPSRTGVRDITNLVFRRAFTATVKLPHAVQGADVAVAMTLTVRCSACHRPRRLCTRAAPSQDARERVEGRRVKVIWGLPAGITSLGAPDPQAGISAALTSKNH
jgi:mono/diheme cytochrome c family protein